MNYTNLLPNSDEVSVIAGPSFWTVLHILCATVDLKDKQKKNDFLNVVKAYSSLFPCEKCREHFKDKLIALPIDQFMESNEMLFFWSYACHDIVNQQNGKVSPKYENVRNEYFSKFKKIGECSSCALK